MSKPVGKERSAIRRSKRSHQAVLVAAQELLAARGYSDITIEQIARKAGVGKATIYRWWPNKASIFMELYTKLAESLQPPMDTGDLAADLRGLVRSAFKLFRKTIAGIALAGFIAEAQSDPEVAQTLGNVFAQQRRGLSRKIFERAKARGEIPSDVSTEIFSDLITGAVYYSILVGNAPMTSKRADAIVGAIINGLPLATGKSKTSSQKSFGSARMIARSAARSKTSTLPPNGATPSKC